MLWAGLNSAGIQANIFSHYKWVLHMKICTCLDIFGRGCLTKGIIIFGVFVASKLLESPEVSHLNLHLKYANCFTLWLAFATTSLPISSQKFRRRVQESTQVLRELEISLRTNHIGWVQSIKFIFRLLRYSVGKRAGYSMFCYSQVGERVSQWGEQRPWCAGGVPVFCPVCCNVSSSFFLSIFIWVIFCLYFCLLFSV